MRPLHLILLGFLVAAAAFPVMADDQSGKTPGNIPVGVTPTHYDITLNVDPNSSTFHGSTRVDVIIAAPTNQVVLNAKDLKISRAVVAGREEIAATVMLDTPHEIATLTFDQSLTPGPSTFVLDYE